MNKVDKDGRLRLLRVKSAMQKEGVKISEISRQTDIPEHQIKDCLEGWDMPDVMGMIEDYLGIEDSESTGSESGGAGFSGKKIRKDSELGSSGSEAMKPEKTTQKDVLPEQEPPGVKRILTGPELKELRLRKGLPQTAVARACNKSGARIGQMENDSNPTHGLKLRKLCQVYLEKMPDKGDDNSESAGSESGGAVRSRMPGIPRIDQDGAGTPHPNLSSESAGSESGGAGFSGKIRSSESVGSESGGAGFSGRKIRSSESVGSESGGAGFSGKKICIEIIQGESTVRISVPMFGCKMEES